MWQQHYLQKFFLIAVSSGVFWLMNWLTTGGYQPVVFAHAFLGPGTRSTFPTLDLIGILTIVWEWLVAVALMFWIGVLVIEGIVLNGEEQRSAVLTHSRKQALPLQWLCLSVLLVAEIIVLILRTASFTQPLSGNALDPAVLGQILFQSTYGFLWIARVILILGSLGLLWWTTNRQNSLPPLTIAWLILAGLILITYTLSGVAAQLATQLHIYAIVLDWFSLAAQYTWFGGLAYLGYILLPLLPMIEPDRRTEILTTLFRRFHPLMLTAICVLFVSELYLTSISLSNIQQFISEPYGRILLVKWALILMMIIFSAYALFVLRPKLTRQATLLAPVNAEVLARQVRQSALDRTTRSFRQVLSVQSWLGAAVLLCAALMTSFVPPIVSPNTNNSQNVPTSKPRSLLTTQTKQVDNLSVTLTVTPGKISVSNTVTVKITDTRSGKLVTNAHIEISTNMELMDMGTARATMTGGTPTYNATFAQDTTFSMAGVWDIRLTIQLPKQVPLAVVFAVLLSGS